jgi:phosphoglycerol transferase MdoB-like AlkP superfamily enzyme
LLCAKLQAGDDLGRDRNTLVGTVSVDDQFGAIMNKLDALQITDNTLVIVCQDHGQISKDTMLVVAIYPACFLFAATFGS